MKKCLQCGKEFEPKNPKGRFCSDKCRVYWNRSPKVNDLTKPTNPIKPFEQPKTNHTVNTHFNKIMSALDEADKHQRREIQLPTMDEWIEKQLRERLIVLKSEIANPPKGLMIGAKWYISVREQEIKEIESKLNNH